MAELFEAAESVRDSTLVAEGQIQEEVGSENLWLGEFDIRYRVKAAANR